MTYVVERKRVKERGRAPEYARNASQINLEIANTDMQEGHSYISVKDYRNAAKSYRHAASFYGEASRDPKLHKDDREHLGLLHDGAMKKAKDCLHKAALEKVTIHMNPIKRWIVKYIRFENVLGLFILSILFSSPSITGASIGSIKASSYLGLIIFFLGIIGCYILVWKKHLLNRVQDQY
ncbi:hypothetical protein FJZ21_01825 [Candidatus Pacearchaeota archaeon]|nr:hypothetical protein [Candidatus Pacearchaeota archaeon]